MTTERDFCWWLLGYFEIAGVGAIPLAQAEIIRDRLAGVFQKPPPPPRAHAGPPAVKLFVPEAGSMHADDGTS